MVENLTDNEILQRLKHCDEKVTKEFFYDTCHIAYCIDNKKYGLQYKTGMDFFSLAHEYYLRLLKNDWRQLEKRKSNITLANWMMNGFHYLVRERLHTYSKGEFEESIEERASKGQLVFDAPDVNSEEEANKMVEEICHAYYGSDSNAQNILRMILIMGMKGKDVASVLGISPAAVSQRYHRMMDQVVRPYFFKYYTESPYYSESRVSFSIPRFKNDSISDEGMRYMERRTSSKSSRKGGLFEFFRKDHKEEDRQEARMRIRVTPSVIHTLQENEVLVFGSDLQGMFCAGTVYQTLRSLGAELGKGIGPQDRYYAIPTIVGGLHNIRPYVLLFINYAMSHPEQVFYVTPVGCGIAGFAPSDIAPLFQEARELRNVYLPQEFLWV